MGSCLSPVVAYIFMEHFKTPAFNTFSLKPKCRFPFVDDKFVILPQGCTSLNNFHNHLNSISPHIKFTMEIQQDQSIPFIHVLVTRQQGGSLSFQVYWKNTHTDHYLHDHSHHHPSQKYVFLKNLITILTHNISIKKEHTLLNIS